MFPCLTSGRGAARLARLHGVQEVGGSNPLAPTEETLEMESLLLQGPDWLARDASGARSNAE